MKKCFFIIFILINAISVSAELYKRAPDVLPGTLPEMRTTKYWINEMEKPDEVILSIGDIERMNEAYQEQIRHTDPFADVPEVRKPRLTS